MLTAARPTGPNTSSPVFAAFAEVVKQRSGIILGADKQALVEARLLRLATENGFSTVSSFLAHITRSRERHLINESVERLTTNHTYFWREPDQFLWFRDNVLPTMKDDLSRYGLVRIWCAAASNGQESWILSGLIQDMYPTSAARRSILATDLSKACIDTAESGVYPDRDVGRLPEAHKQRWFRPRGNGTHEVAPILRGEVKYEPFNLMEPRYPARGVTAVFCRNVLIYFDAPTRARVIRQISTSLKPGGWLFLSQTEGLPEGAGTWTRVAPGIFQRP